MTNLLLVVVGWGAVQVILWRRDVRRRRRADSAWRRWLESGLDRGPEGWER